ncbi:MAG: hypothetical protein AAGI22_08655 [Planctomycetota bacterium]
MSSSDPDRHDSWPRGDALDELLGLDPAPVLPPDAVRAIHERLEREGDGALDALLDLDEVEVPAGLADGVLARVASERRASRLRRRLRVLPVLAAAAAVLVIALRGAGPKEPADPGGSETVADAPTLDEPSDEPSDGPSDEFLAALPVLEDLELLAEDLDPVELDALFLMDAEDALLLDLLEMGG